jgi:hypothetical protein
LFSASNPNIFVVELSRDVKPMSKSLFKEESLLQVAISITHHGEALLLCHLHRPPHHLGKEEKKTWGQGGHEIFINIVIYPSSIDPSIHLVVIPNLIVDSTCTHLIIHTPFLLLL